MTGTAVSLILLGALVGEVRGQIIYREDFNTDGEGSRYVTDGGGVVPGADTAGPAYWARNVDVTAIGKVVGVPAPAPARRALIVFNHALTEASLTPDALKLIDNTVKWLTDGKAKLNILFSAAANPGEGDQVLVRRLTEQGHTVVDDDGGTTQSPEGLPDPSTVDLVINGSSGGEPARLARYAVPLLSYRAAISGDLLLATRGETGLNFDPGEIQIAAPNHPVAAGLPARFSFVTEAQPFDTIGLGLPTASTVVATYQFTDAEGVTTTRPFVVVTEKGAQMLGGLISGFEGAYWAGADLNEPTISNGTFGTPTDPRTLTLKPVNVAGKSNVKLTLAIAGTDVDFDVGADDFLRIMIDPDGNGPEEFTALATFASPSASEKFYTDGKTRIGVVAQNVTYDLPAGATDLVVRFESNSTFWNEIVAFDDVRIHVGDLPPAGDPGQPAELGQTVNGFQDDFTGATRDPNWKVRGPGGDYYTQGDGMLRVSARVSDPNHLLYEVSGYHTNVQEVLTRIRVTAFGSNDAARAGIGVGVATNNSQGINLHFRNFLQDGVAGRQFKLLDDARAWGPAGLKMDWETNRWYWLRLRQDPNAGGGTDDVFGKAWVADGKTPEPGDWQLKWNYIPTRTVRSGFAGITACSIDGIGTFEVDYILIKAEGLPSIKVNFAPEGPQPTQPTFTSIQKSGAPIEIQWIGAGILQQANDGAGPWADVAGGVTPWRVTPAANAPNKIYRLRP